MHSDLLAILACPVCGGGLAEDANALRCATCGRSFPVSRGVPRFVGDGPTDYTENFSLQWNRFRRTQLDSFSGVPISEERFLRQTGWPPAALAGRLVLDVGCGAGRFAEVALKHGARVVAVDRSKAVEACIENLGTSDRLLVLQADMFNLPLRAGAFDFVYCFGVLQHTPDFELSIQSLVRKAKPGGEIVVDF